jgi:Tfp pilus assembly protein PilV
MQYRRVSERARGFTLLEALVAMLVTAFSLVGLVGIQMTLARNADVAKQRGEATRLAQERIEAMRSYTKIDTTAGHVAWADLGNGNDSVASNTTFSRTWTLGGAVGDGMRQATVTVAWVDRAGMAQDVTLSTVISRTDPADVGALGFPLPANTTLKRPKNRNLNIPVRARDLGNGRSAYQLASNFAVVFNNDTGFVEKTCDKTVTTSSDLADGCVTYDAYVLTGYVSKTSLSAFPSTLGVTSAGLSSDDTSRSVQCSFGDATNQDTDAVIAGYKYYLCIVPVTSGGSWSGTLRLSGVSTGLRVCRMQFAPVTGLSANQRNEQPYVDVAESLDSQNYVVTGSGSCPTVDGLATTLHQDCRSSNPSLATDCPSS